MFDRSFAGAQDDNLTQGDNQNLRRQSGFIITVGAKDDSLR